METKYKNLFKKNSLILKYFNIKHLTILSVLVFFLFPSVAFFSNITEQEIINQTNKVRIENGLSKLAPNQRLVEAAQNKANDIIKYNTFEHNFNDTKFSDWIKNAKYEYYYVGENLAIDFMVSEKVVAAWMKSQTHKDNLLNKNFSEIGIAVVDGEFEGRKTTIVVQIFGSPISNITASNRIVEEYDMQMSGTVLGDSSKNEPSNNVGWFIFALFTTNFLLLTIVKIAVVLEHHVHKNNIRHKTKAKINL